MHVHQNEDEHILIIEGKARIAYGNEEFDAASGTAVVLKRNIPHAWCNPSGSPLRMVITCTLGRIEEMLRLIAWDDEADVMALSENFGIRVIGPLLLRP